MRRAERALERARRAAERAVRSPPIGTRTACSTRRGDLLVLNSAHDSSCACSADEVVDAVVVRYQEARQLGDALTRDALRALAARVDAQPGSTIVVQPDRGRPRGLVSCDVPGDGPVHLVADDGVPCPTQVVRTVDGEGFTTVVVGRRSAGCST